MYLKDTSSHTHGWQNQGSGYHVFNISFGTAPLCLRTNSRQQLIRQPNQLSRKATDPCWQFATKLDRSNVQCKLCGNKYSGEKKKEYSNSTWHVWLRHMPEFYRIGQRAFSKIAFTNEEGKRRERNEEESFALFEIGIGRRSNTQKRNF